MLLHHFLVYSIWLPVNENMGLGSTLELPLPPSGLANEFIIYPPLLIFTNENKTKLGIGYKNV